MSGGDELGWLELSVASSLDAWAAKRTAEAMRAMESRHRSLATDCRIRLETAPEGSTAEREGRSEMAVHLEAAAMCRAEADHLEQASRRFELRRWPA